MAGGGIILTYSPWLRWQAQINSWGALYIHTYVGPGVGLDAYEMESTWRGRLRRRNKSSGDGRATASVHAGVQGGQIYLQRDHGVSEPPRPTRNMVMHGAATWVLNTTATLQVQGGPTGCGNQSVMGHESVTPSLHWLL